MLHLYPQKPPPYVKLTLPSFCHLTGATSSMAFPTDPVLSLGGYSALMQTLKQLTELLQRQSDLTLARPPTTQ